MLGERPLDLDLTTAICAFSISRLGLAQRQ
jgi:hypothetical protein